MKILLPVELLINEYMVLVLPLEVNPGILHFPKIYTTKIATWLLQLYRLFTVDIIIMEPTQLQSSNQHVSFSAALVLHTSREAYMRC